MFRLDRMGKAYREAGSFNEQVNLFGFIDDQVFLTKSGDVGVVLAVEGVDYECLDSGTLDNLTKRLESALTIFDEKCRVYQYLFKRNRAEIPFQTYGDQVVDAAIRNRVEYLQIKADDIYSLKIYYVILFEGFRYQKRLLSTIGKLASEPAQAFREITAIASTKKQVVLIDAGIEKARAALLAKARNFVGQVSDFTNVQILSKQEAANVIKSTLNFSPQKTGEARVNGGAFLDCALCESHLECHRGYLRLDDYFVTLHSGNQFNQHLKSEYLAVLETNHKTPYYLNLHYQDVAHTVILGRTGAGKSFLLNFLITNLQKYEPATFIFDLGGSFETLTGLFGGAYVRVGLNSSAFTINPFCLPQTKQNLDFLTLFVKVLMEGKPPRNPRLKGPVSREKEPWANPLKRKVGAKGETRTPTPCGTRS